ncbi:hypothetical protein OHS33_35770 [Streptomyces sp. NBC_00536]|uniref:hypothetical protein n=1 Tax=Streptomyces sp. NBC_00536 TaxID=2975769 RepID=UPI002E81A59D|nr:hypothetical protein [Streptomyces sp. NBC_00536]WUC83265.1 hypothetical protein OHS33_35770 [Streptomyces sp. NBC_00536]
MTTRHDDRGIRAREEVAHVCAQVDYIRTTLETYGAQGAAPLEHLLSALREGQDPAASLDSLHEALLALGDASGIRGRDRGVNPRGVGPARAAERVLLCPTGQCARHAWPEGPETPRCRISGQPLRSERL